MRPRHFLALSAIVTCLSYGHVSFAQGQVAPSNTVTEFKGKLVSFQRGILMVTRDDGTEVMVQPPDDISSFNFVAEAKPAFLQRGALVRFAGVFDANGVALAPIDRVEVFQPIAAQKMPGHLRERYVPGIYGERGQQEQQAMAKYNIVGGLMAISPQGLMMVQAGKTSLRVPLAADAKFELRFNNLSLAQEGDPVSVAGFYQEPDDTKVKADRVTITTERVYGEPSSETPKRTPRRRGRVTAEKEKGDGEKGDGEKGEKLKDEGAEKKDAEKKPVEGDGAVEK